MIHRIPSEENAFRSVINSCRKYIEGASAAEKAAMRFFKVVVDVP